MAIKGEKISLGIYMSGKVLRIIEAQRDNGDIKILRVAETELEAPFVPTACKAVSAEKFSDAINLLVEQEGMLPGAADLAIDGRMTVEQIVVFDNDLDNAMLEDHMEWEVNQLLVSNRDEFNVNYQSIKPLKPGFERYLVVSVRKEMIQYIQDVFDHSSLTLTRIDIDKLAALKTFKATQHSEGLCALVNCMPGVYDIILINDGDYVLSHEISYSENPIKGTDSLNVATDINHTINNLLQQVSESIQVNSLEQVYFFGENFKSELLNHFGQQQSRFQPIHFNPFTSLPLDLDSNSQELIERYPEKFVFSLGMVL